MNLVSIYRNWGIYSVDGGAMWAAKPSSSSDYIATADTFDGIRAAVDSALSAISQPSVD